MQSYTNILVSEKVKDSRELFLDNDNTIRSCNSGTAFPTDNLEVGML